MEGPSQDDGELWCFRGCAVQVQELPYLDADGASPSHFAGDASFPRLPAAPPSGPLQHGGEKEEEGIAAVGVSREGSAEGQLFPGDVAVSLDPLSALSEAVDGVQDALQCGRAVVEEEMARLGSLATQVIACCAPPTPEGQSGTNTWDQRILGALNAHQDPDDNDSSGQERAMSLALQHCRQLLDACQPTSTVPSVTLFKPLTNLAALQQGQKQEAEREREAEKQPGQMKLTVVAAEDAATALSVQPGTADTLVPPVQATAGGVRVLRSAAEISTDVVNRWGDAKFEARVVGCWWAVNVVEPPKFVASMRKSGVQVKVAYALDATDTWWVDSEEGLRVKQKGKWDEGLAQCLRGVGLCQHRGCLAAMQTIARHDDLSTTSSTVTASVARPLMNEEAIKVSASSFPPAAGEIFPLERLDLAALHRILCFLDGESLARLACTCSALRAVATDDSIWRCVQLRHQRHPSTNITVGGEEQSWRRACIMAAAVNCNWRRRRCNKTEWNDHSDFLYHIHRAGDLIVSASADHTLRVFPLRPRNVRPAQSDTALGWMMEGDDSTHTVAPEVSRALRPMPPGSRAGSCLELAGHRDHVTCCSTLDAGRLVISTAIDDTLKIWELPSGRCVGTRNGVVGRGFCKFSLPEWRWGGSGAAQFVCASMSGSGVRVWDMTAWLETTSLEHARQEFYSVCTPVGGSLVLAAAGDGQVHVWDVRQGGAAICTLEGSRRGSVRCVDASDNCIVSGGADGSVRMFDARMWGAVKVLRQHTDLVNVVRLDTRLGLLVSGGDDSRICSVQLPSWRQCNPISTRVGVLSLEFDHSRLLAGCEDNVLRWWDFMVDEAHYMDTDAWSTVARMVEARLRPAVPLTVDHMRAPSSGSQALTAAQHYREGVASPGAGYPHMTGFHS